MNQLGGGTKIGGYLATHYGNILDMIKKVGGSGSGIDADKLDGVEGSGYSLSGHTHTKSQISDMPTNLNQFTNGPGYITGITSSNVTTALGYTPYNATNPNGYLTSTGSIATATNIAGGTIGSIPYQSAAGATTMLADVATGNVLISGGVGAAPSYGKVGLTTHISGILPVANGGNGSSTAPVQGGISYGASTSAYATTAAGTSGQVLKSNGTSAPTWQTLDLTYLPDSAYKKSVRCATTGDIGAASQTATTLTGYTNSQSLACTTTAGSTTVTTTSTAGLKVGAVVSTATAAMASGTTVASITNATTFVVNNRATITTTAITGNGTTATATFAAQTYAPYAVGSSIVISGATPSTYNGTFVVTACTTTSVSWASTTTTTATVQGTITFNIAAGNSITTAFSQSISTLNIDTITVSAGDRVLIKDQTTVGGITVTAGRDNGIFTVTNPGSSTVAWVLTRAADADVISEIAGGTVNVDSGLINGGFIFSNNLKTTDTLATTAMPWYRCLSTFDIYSSNVPDKIVTRDSSGNFEANRIVLYDGIRISGIYKTDGHNTTNAQFRGNWAESNYWGFGTTESNNQIKFGVTDIDGKWISGDVTLILGSSNKVVATTDQIVCNYLGAVSDFNTTLKEGEYNVASTVTISNGPYTGAIYGKLRVYVNDGGTHNNSTNWIWQYFDDTNGQTYFRFKINSGSWSTWTKETKAWDCDTAASANSLAKRDANGYLYSVYMNTNNPVETSTAANYFYDSGDGWHRKKSLANVKTEIVTTAAVQSALSGATLSGTLTAQSNTSYASRQIHNVILGSGDPDVNAMQNGDMYFKYTV